MTDTGIDETRLKRAFLDESEELIEKLNAELLELEGDFSDERVINEVFRLTHSIKSESALMGYANLSEVAHRIEDVFDALRTTDMALTRETMDRVFAGTDMIAEMTARISRGGTDAEIDTAEIVDNLSRSAGQTVMSTVAIDAVPRGGRSEIDLEKDTRFGKTERLQLREGRERGEGFYRLTCSIDPESAMKFARAYLVYSNLEAVSNVITSLPSLHEGVDEGVEEDDDYGTLVVYLTSDGTEEDIHRVADVDEVERIELVRLEYDSFEREPQAAPPEEQPPLVRGDGRATERTSIRVETRKLNDLWSLIGQLVISKAHLARLCERSWSGRDSDPLRDELEMLRDSIEQIGEGMQQAMMETRMVPISVIFSKFPRLVRDLSQKMGKTVNLDVSGEATEIDRSFVEALSDPLTHLIRNAMDHGLEFPEERIRHGKPEAGTVAVAAYQEGGKIVIEIADDGRGLDIGKIRRKALESGFLADGEISDADAANLIFRPGFSTADTITDVSGRGVGMDVVSTRVRDVLKGDVQVRSEEGVGSRFSIVLPLTLTILDTLVVRCGSHHSAIPINNVEETAKIPANALRGDSGAPPALFRGQAIPVYHLRELLGMDLAADVPPGEVAEMVSAVVIAHRDRRAFLIVDEFIEEMDVVIKPIDDVLNPRGLFSGVSVDGDGRILFILDTTFIEE